MLIQGGAVILHMANYKSTNNQLCNSNYKQSSCNRLWGLIANMKKRLG